MGKRISFSLLLLILCLSLLFSGCSNVELLDTALKTLASDSMQGRLAGNIGNEKAVDFMVQQYKSLGLKPFSNNSYLQGFNMDVYDLKSSKIQLEVKSKGGEQYTCIYGKDFLELNKLSSMKLTAPITFDPADLDLENKILVLENREELAEARKRAKGILLKTELFTSNAIVRSQGIPMFQISPALYQQLQNSEVEWISLETDIVVENRQVNNVLGFIPGKDNKKAVIITAHFDHVGYAGKTIFTGAYDNAAGSAVLLNIAKLLKDATAAESYPYDIVFAALNGEEHGLLGSKALLPILKDQYNSFYNINIDTLGLKDNLQILLEGDDHLNEALKSELSQVLRDAGFEVDTESKGYASDNLSFEKAGFCAVNIGQADVSALHSKEDTINILDVDYLKKISKSVAEFIIGKSNIIYEKKESNNSTVDPISPEFMQQMNEYHLEKLKEVEFDEIMVSKFQDTYLIITGSNRFLDMKSLNRYYPNIKIPQQIGQFTFDKARIHSYNKDEIRISNIDNYQLESKYKRNISKDFLLNVSFIYHANNENLYIRIVKERNDITYEDSFDLSSYEKLSVDKSFGIKKTENQFSLVKIFNVGGCNYSADMEIYPIQENQSKDELLMKLYKLQKEIRWEDLIQNVFNE